MIPHEPISYFAVVGVIVLVWLLFVVLFTPAIDYHTEDRPSIEAEDFLHTVQSTCQSGLHHGNVIDVYTNGENFYPAMLDAIRGATRSVNLECYIFEPDHIGYKFVDALSERARAGVRVTVIVDAIGSLWFRGKPRRRLRAAGVRVHTYQHLKWYSLARLNNRTHRELLVVDGRVAFLGGAGIADRWAPSADAQQWRDTMARVEGPLVAAIQGVYAENWLECCGEILLGELHFPAIAPRGDTSAFVVRSSPADRATVSRVVFQLLIEGASREVRITTPYFLPDRPLRRALVATARRGVHISVIVPGRRTDQRLVRLASRRLYGQLLKAGVRIFEYQPAMLHAKILIVDRTWSVLGTTNIDNRSFEHNDEINIAVPDGKTARRLLEDYRTDLMTSTEVTLEDWQRRGVWERLSSVVARLLERQQ